MEQPWQGLIEQATRAMAQAYCPYSKFQVGAALATTSGLAFTGVNVENASYGLTVCAERVALGNAISAGQREFAMLAIATRGGAPPCGACRQVLAEFHPSLPLILIDADTGQVEERLLTDFFPGAFTFRPS